MTPSGQPIALFSWWDRDSWEFRADYAGYGDFWSWIERVGTTQKSDIRNPVEVHGLTLDVMFHDHGAPDRFTKREFRKNQERLSCKPSSHTLISQNPPKSLTAQG